MTLPPNVLLKWYVEEGQVQTKPQAPEIIMPKDADQSFYDRANAHINLSNEQLQQTVQGKVSASMMYATARFNTSLTASGFQSGSEMAANRSKNIEYFVSEYRLMLEEHIDEYIKNFERYMEMARKGV